MDNIDYIKLAEAIRDGLGGGGGRDDGSIAGLVARAKGLSENLKQQNDLWGKLKNSVFGANAELMNMGKEINKEARARSQSASLAERTAIESARSEAMKQIAIRQTINSLQGLVAGFKVGMDVINRVGNATLNIANSLGGSGDEIGAAGNMISSIVGMIPGVGGLLSGIVNLFVQQIKITVESFQRASTVGALFAGGLTELRETARRAGLTLEQFSRVIVEKRADLAALGISVAGATQRFAEVSAAGQAIRHRLLNLGYSFEEQGALFIEVMRDMRQSGGPLTASNEEIVAETEKYAVNLRILSSITGEDGKQRMAQARQAASQLAFQQKLAGMDEKQRTGIIQAMAGMSEIERKNFMDMMNFGTIINKEGAVTAAMIPAYSENARQLAEAARAGNLDAAQQRIIAKRTTGAMKDGLIGLTDFATAAAAGKGYSAELGRALGTELEFRNKYTREAIEEAERSGKAQRDTNDAATNEINRLIEMVQDLRMYFQDLVTNLLPQITGVMGIMLNYLKELVMSIGSITMSFSNLFDMIKNIFSAAGLGAIVGGIGGGLIGGLATGGAGIIPGAMLGAKLGAAGFGGAAAFGTYMGQRAVGGPVASGSTYLVGERGPELFTPGASGTITPNNQLPIGAPISGEIANIMREQLEVMRQNAAFSEQLIGAMTDVRNIQQQLLNNSY